MDSPTSTVFNYARRDEGDVTHAFDAIDEFRRHGFLWIRTEESSMKRCRTEDRAAKMNGDDDGILSELRGLYELHPRTFERHWSVENSGAYPDDSRLSAKAVLGTSDNDHRLSEPFYVSTILRGNDPSLRGALECLPFPPTRGCPAFLDRKCVRHDGGCWLFLGTNGGGGSGGVEPSPTPEEVAAGIRDGRGTNGKKRGLSPPGEKVGRAVASAALSGRAEHVDDVEHDGTWHFQLSGTKTWYIRPNVRCEDWCRPGGGGPPDLRVVDGAERSGRGGRAYRLRIRVEEGDVLVLNTRAWYHRTELEPQEDGVWSVSLARDFHLTWEKVESSIEGSKVLLSANDAKEGEVIFEEDDIPDNLPQGDNPNCVLAEIEHDESDGVKGGSDTSIVLVALRDIREGEPLFVCGASDDDANGSSDGEGGYACNAAEGVDPRAVAVQAFDEGAIVLQGDDIPEDMPRSLEPNCELEEVIGGDGNESVVLRSLRAVACGEVLAIPPDDDEEYDEVEFDSALGRICRTRNR